MVSRVAAFLLCRVRVTKNGMSDSGLTQPVDILGHKNAVSVLKLGPRKLIAKVPT